MALDLDDRQRAMLLEMGVRVWLPGTAFATVPQAAADLPAPARMPAPADTAPAAPMARGAPRPSPAASVPRAASEPGVDASGLDWAALVQTVRACQACGLCAGRRNSTLQVPTPLQADWMVVGDPPDEDEDRTGVACAEAQGLLLDNMLKAAGAARAGQGARGAYVTNITKCRPPQGHLVRPEELAQCAAYLQREIALVQPKIILAMGRFAMQVLLGEHGAATAGQPLGKLRGTVYRYQGVPVVVTYAPKVLLRASADKGKAWADLCLAMDTLETL